MKVISFGLFIFLLCASLSCYGQNNDPSDEDVVSAKAFISQLARGDFPSATGNMNDGMKSALPLDKLQGVWSMLTGQFGEYKKQAGIRTSVEDGYEVVLVTCEFEKARLDTKMLFDDKGKIAGIWFLSNQSNNAYAAPDYVKQGSFFEREVTVGSGEWALPATLTIPNGMGPYPGVVLVHGSGPMDRDESVGPNRPFKDIAWGLASNGIAVLRYEKRTKRYPEKIAAVSDTLTVKEETVDDAVAALTALLTTGDVDSKRIFLLGHSLGGMLLPRIAKSGTNVAGLIILAGNTRPLEDTILEQSVYLLSANSQPEQSDTDALNLLKTQVAKVKQADLSDKTPSSQLPFGIPAGYWLDLRGYNPSATAKELKLPMLILQGARDYQVTTADFQGWKDALASKTDVTLRMYDSLNHLFMAGQGKSTPAEYQIPGHVSGAVIGDIAEWIKGIKTTTAQ